jgi:hypothetical protein
VTQSLINGLQKLNISFNFNPECVEDIGDVVLVLSNSFFLKKCIGLKKEGRIVRLFAGPNLVNLPSDQNRLVMAKEIDFYLVNCHWTKIAYEEDEPLLSSRLRIWFAGLDSDYWSPNCKKKEGNQVLVYWKTEEEAFVKLVESLLEKYGWQAIRMHYGEYYQGQYKQLLDTVKFAVFISKSESQGISLAESWSMDVPTLVWNPKKLVYNGRTYSECSSCPYLTDKTGRDWQTIDEFEVLVKNIENYLLGFESRKWVLENMTNEKSAQCFLEIVQSTFNDNNL